MVPFQIILILNQVYLKALFLVLYYFLFTSMILKEIKSNIQIFVDDTMLISVIKDLVISADDLNHDLDTIRQWASMEIN